MPCSLPGRVRISVMVRVKVRVRVRARVRVAVLLTASTRDHAGRVGLGRHEARAP